MEKIKKKFREIDSFHLTGFLACTFLNFLAYCVFFKKTFFQKLTLYVWNLWANIFPIFVLWKSHDLKDSIQLIMMVWITGFDVFLSAMKYWFRGEEFSKKQRVLLAKNPYNETLETVIFENVILWQVREFFRNLQSKSIVAVF